MNGLTPFFIPFHSRPNPVAPVVRDDFVYPERFAFLAVLVELGRMWTHGCNVDVPRVSYAITGNMWGVIHTRTLVARE